MPSRPYQDFVDLIEGMFESEPPGHVEVVTELELSFSSKPPMLFNATVRIREGTPRKYMRKRIASRSGMSAGGGSGREPAISPSSLNDILL